jgi:cell division protease FtsH
MFVGVGASRVRDLFGEAKKAAPCIIFIDEIDAVGRQRGAGLGGGHDEREQTLNQILVEMDGFETDQSIIVMAATNRPDILDPALMRPGRFDRRVILGRPDVKGREAILKVHAKDKPLESNINFNIIAKLTSGFSGADLQNLLNEAAILAARRNKSLIGMPEIEESIDRVLFGPERKSHKVTDKEKKVTAYHEAGHAIVALILPHADNPRKVTVIPRGMALGYTKPLSEDKDVNTLEQLQDSIAMAMGGRVAEELVFNEISTGASSDIKKATEIAVSMVTEYGMSKLLGPRSFGKHDDMVFLGREISEQRDYGEETANAIDAEVKRIVTEGYESAVKTLTEHRDLLDKLAEGLLEYETLEGEELYKVLGVEMPENMKLLEKEIEEIKNEFGITDGPKAEEPKDEAPAAESKTPKDETETPAE